MKQTITNKQQQLESKRYHLPCLLVDLSTKFKSVDQNIYSYLQKQVCLILHQVNTDSPLLSSHFSQMYITFDSIQRKIICQQLSLSKQQKSSLVAFLTSKDNYKTIIYSVYNIYSLSIYTKITLRTILLSEVGVLPTHRANLQGSPSTCSVTPNSEVWN